MSTTPPDTPPPPADFPRIVISYRRNCPSVGTTFRIYDKLAERYGPQAVFFDQSNLTEGNFPLQIRQAIDRAAVLLVVVGRDWAGTDSGTDRILDPRDWVRQEVQHAYNCYQRSKRRGRGHARPRLVCVSVDGAMVPDRPTLRGVACLKHLIFNNALQVASNRELTGMANLLLRLDVYVPPQSSAATRPTVDELVARLNAIVPQPPARRWVIPAFVGALVVAVIALATAVLLIPKPQTDPTTPTMPTSTPPTTAGSEPAKTTPTSPNGSPPAEPPSEPASDRVPAKFRVTGFTLAIDTPDGGVIRGGLGQETREKGGALVTTHPQSGFALLGVTLDDLAKLVVVVNQDGGDLIAEPSEYRDGYAYVPGEASKEKPATITLYWKK